MQLLSTLTLAAGTTLLLLSIANGLIIRNPMFIHRPAGAFLPTATSSSMALDRIWAATTSTFYPSLLLLGGLVISLLAQVRSRFDDVTARSPARIGAFFAAAIIALSGVGLVTSFLEPIYPTSGPGSFGSMGPTLAALIIAIGCVVGFQPSRLVGDSE